MTVIRECEDLDAFLSDDLGAVATGRFELHLRECAACRDAIDEQRWIDKLLRSSAALHDESAPDTVLQSFRTSLDVPRRRAKLAVCVAAAAAVVVIAAGWTALHSRHTNSPIDSAKVTTVVPIRNRAPAPPRATFVGGPNVIVIPVESRHSDVTIVRVYPTYRSTYASQASADQSPGTDEYAWPSSSNGG